MNITTDINVGLSDADKRLNQLKDGLDTTNSNLNTTNGNLDTTNGKVNDLETNLDETNSNLNTTNGKVNDLETGLGTANDRIDGVEGQIQDLGPNILEQARQNATDLINSGFGSYVRVYPDRILIMDTNNEMTAKKVWQWNVNGLGYSSTGVNGPYGVAITKDGSIVADFIKTGTLDAGMVRTGFNEYGNTIKMMPEGLQSQVNGVKRMELNNLGQLMIYDADATRIGSLGYQYRVSDNSKGVTMNITPGRYLSFSVYNPTTDLHDPNFEIVDTTTTYGTRGIFAWRDMWMNARQLVLSDANLGAKKNYIQELLFTGSNTKRLGLISDTGIDFLLRENNANTAWAGLNSTSFYTYKPLHVYSGGISFNEDGTYLKGGIRKDATNTLFISNEGKTQFMYKQGDTSYVLMELSTWDRINFWKTLDMNGYSIVNADIRSTLTNVNAASLSTYSLDTPKPIEKEMFAPLNSNETYTHVGNGSTVDGYTRIDLPDFLQYETENYHVFLSKYGRGDIWVSNRTETYFTIESDRDIDFSYEIKIVKKEPEVSKFSFRAATKRKPSIFDRHTEEKVLTESDIETVNNEGGIKL